MSSSNKQVTFDSIPPSRYAYPGYSFSLSQGTISILAAREIYGRIRYSDAVPGRVRNVQLPDNWDTDSLSSFAAWNPKRLQNMILSVGPGTPASHVSSLDLDEAVHTSLPSSTSQSEDDEGQNESSDGDRDDVLSDLVIDMPNRPLIRISRSSESSSRQMWTCTVHRSRRSFGINDNNEGADSNHDDTNNFDDGNILRQEKVDEDNSDFDVESNESKSGKHERRRRVICDSENLSSDSRVRSNSSDRKRRTSGLESCAAEAASTQEADNTGVSDEEKSGHSSVHQESRQFKPSPYETSSIKHNGCINAAAWLSCSWRLSLAHADNAYNDDCISSSYAINYERKRTHDGYPITMTPLEYPTQIITSGDDRLVKFWDISASMGNCSESPECSYTPFSSPYPPDNIPAPLVKRWRRRYEHGGLLPGTVKLLASLRTGHRGNIFHVTPLPEKPGKVVTCAADGFLMLSDVELQSAKSTSWTSSAVIVSPRGIDDAVGNGISPLLGLGEMCFSHCFIDPNTGLLCARDGLHRFDVRLPPQSQPSRSILGHSPCKACTMWPIPDEFRTTYITDSTYVFAGGVGPSVGLFDLRFVTDGACKIIQEYAPAKLASNGSISVSGIDVSRDKRELLVSYENDGIYTFPVLSHTASPSGPTQDELDTLAMSTNNFQQRELASYGGHLNRLTFLKCAKYAGPKDEYICTGSDSGHAWIYDKATGSVASLLKADCTTCNGIIPHPCLPIFITYGIDSTAKIWRASLPVSYEIDDSEKGRREYLHQQKYEKSYIVDNWKGARITAAESMNVDDESVCILPDEFPARESIHESNIMFGSLSRILFRTIAGESDNVPTSFKIRNDLKNLPLVLSQNLSTCVQARGETDDRPIQGAIVDLKRRISLMRLRHQADQLGYSYESSLSVLDYLTKQASKFGLKEQSLEKAINNAGEAKFVLPDVIPNHPSDWFPFTPDLSDSPLPDGMDFAVDRHSEFYWENYRRRRSKIFCSHDRAVDDALESSKYSILDFDEKGKAVDDVRRGFLFHIVMLLKEFGNEALKSGHVHLAATYYDKALRYCSPAFILCEHGSLNFLKDFHNVLAENGGHYILWTPFFTTFLNIRLNLAAVMMKPDIWDLMGASQQVRLVIDALKPFTSVEGKVLIGRKLDNHRIDEPVETFVMANKLKAKAYFRLGSAQYSLGEFSDATRSFESSVKVTRAIRLEPENIVLRRLAEARNQAKQNIDRQRKKFKMMFASEKDGV